MKNSQKPLSTRKLAAAVGKAHSTIGRFLKANPDCPRHDLDAFAEYYSKRALTITGATDGNEYARERVLKLRADRKLAEERLRVLQDAYLPKEEALETMTRCASQMASLLRFRLCRELPAQLGGLNAAQAKAKIEKILDDCWNQTREGGEQQFNELEKKSKLKSSQRSASKSKPRKPKTK
jgi:IS30 family transposase